jgi:hypothetical protein
MTDRSAGHLALSLPVKDHIPVIIQLSAFDVQKKAAKEVFIGVLRREWARLGVVEVLVFF